MGSILTWGIDYILIIFYFEAVVAERHKRVNVTVVGYGLNSYSEENEILNILISSLW